jgi:surface antigen
MKALFRLRNVMAICAVVTVTAACSSSEQTGQLIGGVAGAAAGTQVGGGTGQTVATIGGALIGAFIGGQIGGRMDERDHQRTNLALENSPTGEDTLWINPDSGDEYNIRPINTYQTASGPCRDYTMRAVIDGREETIQGTACRQSDGVWK